MTPNFGPALYGCEYIDIVQSINIGLCLKIGTARSNSDNYLHPLLKGPSFLRFTSI